MEFWFFLIGVPLTALVGGWGVAKRTTWPWMLLWGAIGTVFWTALLVSLRICIFDGITFCQILVGKGLVIYLITYGLSRLVLSKRAKK